MRSPSRIAALLVTIALAAHADTEIGGRIGYESTYRTSQAQGFDVNRALVDASLKHAHRGVPVEGYAEAWAWQNFSARNYGLTNGEVSLRALKAAYWGDTWNVTAGLQELSWGETFGFQPVDILCARNYRDYSLLDHGRNKIPIPAVKAYLETGPLKLQAILNPRGETAILPRTIAGAPVADVTTAREMLKYPEGGAKASVLLADANVDVFAYRHLNRFPVLLATASGLVPHYEPVASYGLSFSKGFQDFVVRADSIATPGHPASDATLRNIVRKDAYSAVLGVDWSPAGLLPGLTVAVQGNLDRYPVAAAETTYGASFLVRKTLFDDRLELEAQAFKSVNYANRWIQAKATLKVAEHWELKALGEFFQVDASSPLSVLGDLNRVGGQVTYVF